MSITDRVTQLRKDALAARYGNMTLPASDVLMLADEIIKLRKQTIQVELAPGVLKTADLKDGVARIVQG